MRSTTLSAKHDITRQFLQAIHHYPMLSKDEEIALSRAWRHNRDVDAVHKLVTSHLRLIVKIAAGYRDYGLPLSDLVSEGSVGLLQAVKHFDPDRGFRLSAYAMWWIRATIQEYILRSWSLVKLGTTAAQKRLFFNLRRLKGQMQAIDQGELQPEQVVKIAHMLDVRESDVVNINHRLAGPDHSLNAPVEPGMADEWQDWLVDETDTQETILAEREELAGRKEMLSGALNILDERERYILDKRWLKDDPATLETLAQRYGVSSERVRKLEVRALSKLRKAMQIAVPSDARQALPLQ